MTPAAGHLKRAWRPLAALLIVAVAWEASQRLGLLPVYIPSPSQIFLNAVAKPALVYANIGPTLGRAAAGFAIAALVTLAAASIAALVRPLQGAIYNLGATLHSIPIIAMAPLLALWIGTGTSLHITIAALACQFPMLVGVAQGLKATDAGQRELMIVLSANKAQTLRYLQLPVALPYLFAGLKIAAPSAILGTITAEWAGADRGVGAMMLYALFSYDTPTVWLAVILTCLLSAAGYGFWALMESLVIVSGVVVELVD